MAEGVWPRVGVWSLKTSSGWHQGGARLGAKTYLSRLERRAESWLPLETRPDSPGEPGMQPRDPCLPWRGTRSGLGARLLLICVNTAPAAPEPPRDEFGITVVCQPEGARVLPGPPCVTRAPRRPSVTPVIPGLTFVSDCAGSVVTYTVTAYTDVSTAYRSFG